jgi:hypothetical protein
MQGLKIGHIHKIIALRAVYAPARVRLRESTDLIREN